MQQVHGKSQSLLSLSLFIFGDGGFISFRCSWRPWSIRISCCRICINYRVNSGKQHTSKASRTSKLSYENSKEERRTRYVCKARLPCGKKGSFKIRVLYAARDSFVSHIVLLSFSTLPRKSLHSIVTVFTCKGSQWLIMIGKKVGICMVQLKFHTGFLYLRLFFLSVAGCFQACYLCRCDSKRYACGNQYSADWRSRSWIPVCIYLK